ncbi:MAG: hypothetical protein WCE48_02105 [Steroidobacteraceae bacterium]
MMSSLAACASHPGSTVPPVDPRPALLASLDGRWVMTGDVLGKPVTYRLVGRPVLGSAFTELHMKDVKVPAQYEARVFIGYDKESGQVIVHWLDKFGARYSIPHAIGTLTGNTIQFQFAYADGPFRDTFSFDPTRHTWSFLLESSERAGEWKHFARYEVKR